MLSGCETSTRPEINALDGSHGRQTPTSRIAPSSSRRASTPLIALKSRRTSTPSVYPRPSSSGRCQMDIDLQRIECVTQYAAQVPEEAQRIDHLLHKEEPEDDKTVSGKSRDEKIQELVDRVTKLISSVAAKLECEDLPTAIQEAREAKIIADNILEIEDTDEDSQQNDIIASACLALAMAYERNGQQSEAMEIYKTLSTNPKIQNSGRFRLNLGNLYFSRSEYHTAIKMYKMALDKLPESYGSLRRGIMKNIAVALMKMGKVKSAIEQYERIAQQSEIDPQLLKNMLWCYGSVEDVDGMRNAFERFVSDLCDQNSNDLRINHHQTLLGITSVDRCLVDCAKHLISRLEAAGMEGGYDWCVDVLQRHGLSTMAQEVLILKADSFVVKKRISDALRIYKEVEEKAPTLQTLVTKRLAVIYSINPNAEEAESCSLIGRVADRFCPESWIHKGNMSFKREEYELAMKSYDEAIQIDPENIDALYNRGLVAKQLVEMESDVEKAETLVHVAEASFRQLHAKRPEFVEVIYQLGSLFELQNRIKEAIEWFELVHSLVPNDSRILARLGSLWLILGDEAKAVSLHQESYELYAFDLDVLCWLAAFYVNSDMYEKALEYFSLAAQLQPAEIKWSLMVASCYRRAGQIKTAFDHYLHIHHENPESTECLRFLAQLCEEVGKGHLRAEFDEKLKQTNKMQSLTTKNVETHETKSTKPPLSSTINDSSSILSISSSAVGKTRDIEWGVNSIGVDLLPL